MTEEQKDRYVKVHTVENRFEADQIGEALKREGVPYWIKSYMDSAYDGIYVARKGWGGLWVPEGCEDEARKIIDHFLEAFESDTLEDESR